MYIIVNDGASLKINLKYDNLTEATTIAKITMKEA